MLFLVLGVFLGMFLLDFLWAACVRYTSSGQAFKAASIGSVMHIIQGLVTIAYVHEPLALIGAAAGGFLGVLFGVRWAR